MTKQNIFATLSNLEEEIQSMLSLKQPVELNKEDLETLRLDWVRVTTLSDKQFTLAFPFISHYLSGDYKWLEMNTDDYYFAEEFDFYIPFGQTNIPQNEPLLFMKMGNTIHRENQFNGELFVAQEVCFDYDEIVRFDVSGSLNYMEIGEEAVYIDTLKSYQVLRERNTTIFSIIHQLDTILEKGQLEIDREQYDSMCETYLIQILKEYKELKRIFESYDSNRFTLIYESYDDILSDIETVEEMLQELYESEAILYIGEIEHLFIPIEGREFFKTKKVCNNREHWGTVGEYIDKFLTNEEES